MNGDFNILIVDDDIDYLRSVEAFFESTEMKIQYAESGEKALRIVSEKPIDMIFTDFNMPKMDGLELARRTREIRPNISVILITGNISPDVADQARETGISRVITKPVSLGVIQKIAEDEKEAKERRNTSLHWNSWKCPRCETSFVGWSQSKICSKCGYEEY